MLYLLNNKNNKFNTRKTDIQDTPELTKMFEDKLRKLEQEGYGNQMGGCDCEMYGSGGGEMYNHQLPRCKMMF